MAETTTPQLGQTWTWIARKRKLNQFFGIFYQSHFGCQEKNQDNLAKQLSSTWNLCIKALTEKNDPAVFEMVEFKNTECFPSLALIFR